MEQRKKSRKDRRDGWYLGELDSMHKFMPYLLPNRADNEAVMIETIDLTALEDFVAKKNAADPSFKYTIFHVLCAAVAKAFALRPGMNRFISGRRIYDRKDILLSFVVKKQFADNAYEALAILKMDKESPVSPLEQIHSKLESFVTDVRVNNKTDGTTGFMDQFVKMPRWLLNVFVKILFFLDYHGHMPQSLMNEDPYYSSAFISNLGSIKMKASYHHLTNYGTNSFFMIIGEKHRKAFFNDDGSYEMRSALELGLTIDERIADGVYYAKTVALLRRLIANPELLELPLSQPLPEETAVKELISK